MTQSQAQAATPQEILLDAAARPDREALAQAIAGCQAAGLSIGDIVNSRGIPPLLIAISAGLADNVELLGPLSDLREPIETRKAVLMPDGETLPAGKATPMQEALGCFDAALREDRKKDATNEDKAAPGAANVVIALARAMRDQAGLPKSSVAPAPEHRFARDIQKAFRALSNSWLKHSLSPMLEELYPALTERAQTAFWSEDLSRKNNLPELWALRLAQLLPGKEEQAKSEPLWVAIKDGDPLAVIDFLVKEPGVAATAADPNRGQSPLVFCVVQTPKEKREETFLALLEQADIKQKTLGDGQGRDAVSSVAHAFDMHHSFIGRRRPDPEGLARDERLFFAVLDRLRAAGDQNRIDELTREMKHGMDETLCALLPLASEAARQDVKAGMDIEHQRREIPQALALLERMELGQSVGLGDGPAGFAARRGALSESAGGGAGPGTEAKTKDGATAEAGLPPRRV
jgi:hypothetical protein